MHECKINKETEKKLKKNKVLIRSIILVIITYLSGFPQLFSTQVIYIINSNSYFYEFAYRAFVLFFSGMPTIFYLMYIWRNDNTIIFKTKK